MKNKRRRGTALLEFAMTGPPLIFIWISTIQMSLGMWHYHTLQYAVKVTGNYLSAHGADNSTLKIKDLAGVMKTYSIGVPPSSVYVTFSSVSSTDHSTVLTSVNCELNNPSAPANGCDQITTSWLPTSNNSVGSEFEIQAEYRWNPAIGIVTPGAGRSFTFGSFWLPAYTHQVVFF